jgi:hypothetical protein
VVPCVSFFLSPSLCLWMCLLSPQAFHECFCGPGRVGGLEPGGLCTPSPGIPHEREFAMGSPPRPIPFPLWPFPLVTSGSIPTSKHCLSKPSYNGGGRESLDKLPGSSLEQDA